MSFTPPPEIPFEVEVLSLPPDPRGIPNHPDWPALIYRQVRSAGAIDLASWWNQSFARHGWDGIWRWTVYDFPHFHPNAHEVLGVARGSAVIQVGGAAGQAVEVSPGDLLLLPAGTGHQCLQSSRGFQVVGAYPTGQAGNVQTWRPVSTIDETLLQDLRAVPAPDTDPATGLPGPLDTYWTA